MMIGRLVLGKKIWVLFNTSSWSLLTFTFIFFTIYGISGNFGCVNLTIYITFRPSFQCRLNMIFFILIGEAETFENVDGRNTETLVF